MSPLEGVNRKALTQPAMILAAVAVICSALWWTSDRYKNARVTALQHARSDLNMARDEYRLAVEADGILRTSHQRYRQLEQRGFVGDEPRLLWVESLRTSGREHHLYNLQYSLRQRQAVQLGEFEGAEHYQLYVSRMQLQLDLAHEVDLLRYFSNLDSQRPAVYQLRSCTLKPLLSDNDIALNKANVNATCELLWYTVKDLASIEPDEELL
jgi:hypothetical protein